MTTTATPTDNVTLYYRHGASDKVYHVAVQPKAHGFVVNFAYGRRGSTLQTGTKTTSPVDYESARRLFNKLVKEKTAKGYTPDENGTPYQHTEDEERVSGVLPQLLNPIDEIEAEHLIADDRWWVQEKFDGQRLLIRKRGPEVVGINRQGLLVGMPLAVVTAVQQLAAHSCLLDGEAVGDGCHVFDLLQRDGQELRTSPYTVRYAGMVDLVDGGSSDNLRYAETAIGTRAKREMLRRLREQNREGAVFKHKDAVYTPGRPASGGTQLKLKFVATASCIVSRINDTRRSVALELVADDGRVGVGNVTIPPNHILPSAGDVVEVRYLYAYPGGSLYQPVYLGPRRDVAMEECVVGQLKFKATSE